MGDPRNWTDRKVRAVRAENAAEDRRRLVEVTLYHHGVAELRRQAGPNFLTLNPCETFRVFRFSVAAVCVGCRHRWDVAPYELLGDSPLAHRHWPYVMSHLICPDCTSCPRELRFSGTTGGEVGAISIDPVLTLYPHDTTCIAKPMVSGGLPDPDAQHDDGPGW